MSIEEQVIKDFETEMIKKDIWVQDVHNIKNYTIHNMRLKEISKCIKNILKDYEIRDKKTTSKTDKK